MMTIRKMVMAQMARGVEVIKGSFTVGDNDTTYALQFGKTLSRYMYLIEMTDQSKAELISTVSSGVRVFAFAGMYPMPEVNNTSQASVCVRTYRVTPSTGVVSSSTYYDNNVPSSTAITLNAVSVSSGGDALYRGYTYNYIIIPIE